MAVLAIAVRAKRVAKKFEGFAPGIPNRGLRLVEGEPKLDHHLPRPRQRLCRRLAAEDDEVVGIGDDGTPRPCANTSSAASRRRSTGRARWAGPSKLAPFIEFLRERVAAFPDLSAARLTREIRELGYAGAYTAVKRFLAAIRPENGPKPYEVRFETPPGLQAQVDFARFVVNFTDEPGTSRVVWLFGLVLGHSRFLFARYVLHQDLQTLLRCHIAGLRGDRRRADRDPLRPHEDRGDRRGRSGPHRLQPLAARAGAALSLSAACLPALSGEDEGKGRAAVQLYPPGLLPRPQLPQPRRSQRSAHRLARYRRQCPRPRHHPAHRRRGVSRPSSPNCRRCPSIASTPCSSSNGASATTASSRSAAITTACPIALVGSSRSSSFPDLIRILDLGNIVAEHPVLEGRKQYRIDRSHRTGGSAKRKTNMASGVIIGRIGDHVPLRPLAIYQAIGAQLANAGRP